MRRGRSAFCSSSAAYSPHFSASSALKTADVAQTGKGKYKKASMKVVTLLEVSHRVARLVGGLRNSLHAWIAVLAKAPVDD